MALVYRGIKESRNASNFLVVLKLMVFVVIAVGAFYVKPENWSPFAPNGSAGVLSGVAAVFFAFIGFDSISTTAEECKNPQHDLPRAMIYCLIICTVLYIAITLVLTGMVNYTELRVDDPLAYVFEKLNLNFMAGVIWSECSNCNNQCLAGISLWTTKNLDDHESCMDCYGKNSVKFTQNIKHLGLQPLLQV